ncbi:MAG: hypothetical protein NVSMB49_16490 [Ktedonobacteraceae bacterium]
MVNVVDLMRLYLPNLHPHEMDEVPFVEEFTEAQPVLFAFRGYQRAIHELVPTFGLSLRYS